MLNPRLDNLSDYPFDRLRALLRDVVPPAGLASIGCRSASRGIRPPACSPKCCSATATAGAAIRRSRERRSSAGQSSTGSAAATASRPGLLDPDRHVLPVAGTREALYLIADVVLDGGSAAVRPVVVMPNPFYQVYYGAAVMAGAEPLICRRRPRPASCPMSTRCPRPCSTAPG